MRSARQNGADPGPDGPGDVETRSRQLRRQARSTRAEARSVRVESDALVRKLAEFRESQSS